MSKNLDYMPKTFAEFFAGIGLMRLGLEAEGWAISYANDIDPLKHAMYQGHFGQEEHFQLGDIHNVSVDSLPTVTLATASFPCTDLSLAGARTGLSGTQSSAFWGFVSLLERLGDRRPPLILLENVTGFLTSCGGEDFKKALIALNRLDYGTDAFVLDATAFVPQSRQRLFVVGSNMNRFPTKSYQTNTANAISPLRPKALRDFIFLHPEVQWNIHALPPLITANRRIDDILDNLPAGSPYWWSSERAAYLLNQMSVRHREIADNMIAAPTLSYATVFRRIRNGRSMAELRSDGIAGCLRTPKGGSGRQILFVAGNNSYRVRLLTPRECARLMGADDYIIDATLNQALFGFGDAVCVPAVTWIARNYLGPLLDESVRVTQVNEEMRSLLAYG